MNALPVGIEHIADARIRSEYLRELEQRGFDVAVTTFLPSVYFSAENKFRQALADFVAEAHGIGCPVCAVIPTSEQDAALLSVAEAQYDISNNPVTSGQNSFFASPASDVWKEHLQGYIALLVRDVGIDWVAIEEPAYVVDLPGVNDRFHAKFAESCPDCQYPDSSEETTAYLLVQQAKMETILEFCTDMIAQARAVGAKSVGVVPQTVLPVGRDGADQVPRTACDLGRFAQSDQVDFLVSRMGPSVVHSGGAAPGSPDADSPVACYIEAMAHSIGKPVLTILSPYTNGPGSDLLPPGFYQDALLSVLPAASSGLIAGDYAASDAAGEAHRAAFDEIAPFFGRVGQLRTPLAFVFSDSGGRHAPPNDYKRVFSHYWAFARRMATCSQTPFLTFHAETLQGSLKAHPEVRVLVFEEHFPLTVEQMRVIRDWWEGPEKRAIVTFGSGVGLSADNDHPGEQPFSYALPGVVDLIGLKQDPDAPAFVSDRPIGLRDVSRVRRSAFLQHIGEVTLDKVVNVRRVFGSRAVILYEADLDDPKIPVVAEWKDRTTLAIFCGFGLDESNLQAAEQAVFYALKETDCSSTVISECSNGLLVSVNRNDYVVISNISDKQCRAVGKPGRSTFWDCRQQKMLTEAEPEFIIEPHSFGVYRIVGRRSKFFDIKGVSCLNTLVDGAGRAEIGIVAGRQTTLVLRAAPKDVRVDGKICAVTQELVNDAFHVTLQQCDPGERHISLTW